MTANVWRRTWWVGLGLLWLAGDALAAGGSLPRGNRSPGNAGKVKAPKQMNSATAQPSNPACDMRLAAPVGRRLYFPQGDELAYVVMIVGKSTRPGVESYGVFEVDLVNEKADVLFSMNQFSSVVLGTYAEPVTGVTLVGYQGQSASCQLGESVAIAAMLRDKKQPVRRKGQFRVVGSEVGMRLADLATSRILQIDPKTFQQRTLRKIPSKEIPIFYGRGMRFVTWRQGKTPGIVEYRGSSDKPIRSMAIRPPNEYVLQDRGNFGVLKLNPTANTLEIITLAEWGQSTKDARYKIKLPSSMDVREARIDVNIASNLALVMGRSESAQQRWARAAIYNIKDGKLVGEIKGRGDAYVADAGISPGGGFALGEMRSVYSGRSTGVTIVNLDNGKSRSVPIEVPK